MKCFTPVLLAVAELAAAQATAKAYTDPATGIEYQTFTSKAGSKFGVALPETGSKDLIGILTAPKGYTYAGGVLGPAMNGTILIVAWPHGNKMMGSIRKVPDGARPHAAPPEFTTNISLSAIPKGSFVSPSGDWQYSFLCQNCLGRKDVYPATRSTEDLSWALSVEELSDPGNQAGPLNHHHGGSGKFSADLTKARHGKYAQWASMAQPKRR